MNDTSESAKKLNLSFTNLSLLTEALTHRSYINEHKDAGAHNERLEFLGDAVLELVATNFLYLKFPKKPEGELTALRAALVNTVSLAETAHTLRLNDVLLLSRGEARDTGRARDVILANAFEAIVGAIYLDQGYAAAEDFITKHLFPKTDLIIKNNALKDAKSLFQEAAQEERDTTPSYKLISESGPDHDRHFTIGVFIGAEEIAQGEGKSKQEAEQVAAQNALSKMGW